MIDGPCRQPCQQGVVRHAGDGPSPARLRTDGRDRGDAGEVEQDEYEERQRRGVGEIAARRQTSREIRRLFVSVRRGIFGGRSRI